MLGIQETGFCCCFSERDFLHSTDCSATHSVGLSGLNWPQVLGLKASATTPGL